MEAGSANALDLWLVNDDAAQLMVQKRLLSRVASVEGFLSPLEALAAARVRVSSRFLITDFHMPGMDGPELARVWCDMHTEARVLVISASDVSRQEQEKIDSLPAGSVKLLTSYRITELQEQAKTWFGQQGSPPNTALKAPEDAEQRLDRSVLQKLAAMGGPAFVTKTVARFLQGGPEKVQGIGNAFEAKDYARMHELSHALKGSCGLVGAVKLSLAADKVEMATGEEPCWHALEAHVREIKAECEATIADLEAFRL